MKRIFFLIGVLAVLLLVASCGKEVEVTAPDDSALVKEGAQSFTELAASGATTAKPAAQQPSSAKINVSVLANSALTFFTDRNQFNAACPNLPLEDFEGSNTTSVTACAGPFNSATNDACYSTGALLPGFGIDNVNSGNDPSGLVVIPPGGSTVVGANVFADDTDITFSTGNVGAAGFDLVDVAGGGTWNVEFFGPSGSLGSTPATNSPGGSFIGALSSGLNIVRIEIRPISGFGGELIDNLTFGPCILEIEVDIDIKPGSDPNSINCNNPDEVISVAVLTTNDFDATTVDQTTVTFEGAVETHVNKKTLEARRHEEDVDGDNDTDLVLHFRLGDTNLGCGSTQGQLKGETFGGQPIAGTDVVRMVNP